MRSTRPPSALEERARHAARGRLEQRRGQLRRPHVAVRRHERAPQRRRELRAQTHRLRTVDPSAPTPRRPASTPRGSEPLRPRPDQLATSSVPARRYSTSRIRLAAAASAMNSSYSRQAPDGQFVQRALARRFDVGREHTGGRLRRAGPAVRVLDDRSAYAAPRELTRRPPPDDARADDDDIPLVAVRDDASRLVSGAPIACSDMTIAHTPTRPFRRSRWRSAGSRLAFRVGMLAILQCAAQLEGTREAHGQRSHRRRPARTSRPSRPTTSSSRCSPRC